jgi:hypothetical protein
LISCPQEELNALIACIESQLSIEDSRAAERFSPDLDHSPAAEPLLAASAVAQTADLPKQAILEEVILPNLYGFSPDIQKKYNFRTFCLMYMLFEAFR